MAYVLGILITALEIYSVLRDPRAEEPCRFVGFHIPKLRKVFGTQRRVILGECFWAPHISLSYLLHELRAFGTPSVEGPPFSVLCTPSHHALSLPHRLLKGLLWTYLSCFSWFDTVCRARDRLVLKLGAGPTPSQTFGQTFGFPDPLPN